MPTDHRAAGLNVALREASRALTVGRANVDAPDLSEHDCRVLASELTATLDALVALLRAGGLASVPTSSTRHALFAVIQQLNGATALTRGVGQHDGDGTGELVPSADHTSNVTADD